MNNKEYYKKYIKYKNKYSKAKNNYELNLLPIIKSDGNIIGLPIKYPSLHKEFEVDLDLNNFISSNQKKYVSNKKKDGKKCFKETPISFVGENISK